MDTSSKTSSCAGVTAVGFKLIGAIGNFQSEFEVEVGGCSQGSYSVRPICRYRAALAAKNQSYCDI